MVARVPDQVFAALERGATVVTPHERAARFVRSAWDLAQRSLRQPSWKTASAHSWPSWTAQLWHSLLLDGATDLTLLRPAQERYLWSSILEHQSPAFPRAGLSALVTHSMEAHRRLEEFESATLLERNGAAAARKDPLFTEGLRQLQARCRGHRLLPAAELEKSLTRSLHNGASSPRGRELVLFGFDDLVPARRALLAAWRQRGGVATELAPASFPALAFTHQAEDHTSEVHAFAHWARSHLHAAPQARLALIVNDLREQRDEIEAILQETLAPELANLLAADTSTPYEFSLGRPLSAEPLIQTALDLLRWTLGPLPLPRISRVLLSAHVGTSGVTRTSGLEARALLDRRLRRELRLQPQATLSEALAVLERLSSTSPGDFAELHRLLRALRHSDLAQSTHAGVKPRRRASLWIASIRSALAATSWGAHPSSYTFQLQQRWESLLDEIATLDLLGAELLPSDLLASLQQQVQSTVFAPQSRDASVQVLGPLEAAGQTFDAVWVLRCGDLEWPPQRLPTALIPLAVQQELGMPAADRQRERDRAARLTASLASAAPRVVFSYARRAGDAAEQHLSVLVQALQLPLLDSTSITPAPAALASPLPLEHLTAEPAIPPLPSTAVAGGARLLQLQSACGFRAFAELRLHSHELETRAPGLDARERGIAVHQALDALWKHLESQQRLRALTSDQHHALLNDAVDFGLRQAIAAASSTWDTAYLDLQRTRLHRLLRAWLSHELERTDFTVLAHEIQLDHVPVGPLHLSVRIDRVDQVNGSRVLLDYKTSKSTAAAWKGERPDQPQMLLYAMLAAAGHLVTAPESPQGRPDALAFANILAGREMSLSGVQHDASDLLPLSRRSRSDDLSRDLAAWRRIVERLATEFASGDVRVNPSNYPTTCRHCGQHLLCRLDPDLLADSALSSEDLDPDDV